ncbi:MAG: CoA transferase [Burkholderiaceae bacterium]
MKFLLAQTSGPVDLFQTRDGWILCQVVGRPLYERWARLMGEPEWLTDERFATDDLRGQNAEALSERMQRWCAQRTNEQALGELGEARIPCAPMLDQQAALEHPAVQGLELLEQVAFPGLSRPAPIARAPVWLSETGGSIRHGAPTLGEHTDAILESMGYDAARRQQLRDKGII